MLRMDEDELVDARPSTMDDLLRIADRARPHLLLLMSCASRPQRFGAAEYDEPARTAAGRRCAAAGLVPARVSA